MTSLIDVIFLLLLFFMLSSTFSRFSEIELAAAGQSATVPAGEPPLFLQLAQAGLRLNGQSLPLGTLANALTVGADPDAPRIVLISLDRDVTAQRLTDLLVVLGGLPGVAPVVLGSAS